MNTYTLDKQTVSVLKNFSRINEQMVFRAGTFQRTCHSSQGFLADVELDVPIPVDCALYDVNNLLGIIDIGTDGAKYPTLEFGENSLVVKSDYSSVTLPYANKAVVAAVPDYKFTMAEPFASFTLPNSKWSKIKSVASILEAEQLEFDIIDGKFGLSLMSRKDKGKGNAAFTLPDEVVHSGIPNNTWVVSLQTLELLPGDYHVVFGNITSTKSATTKLFGALFTLLNGPKVTYISAGNVKK